MFHFLAFIFIIIIAVLLIGLSLVGSVIRAIFGLGRRPSAASAGRAQSNGPRNATREREEERVASSSEGGRSHKKIFTKEDGEYVDFEEIKS